MNKHEKMTEARTVAIIGAAAGGAVFICLLILVFFLIMRLRYNKRKATHPSEDPRDNGKLFACYAYCCLMEKDPMIVQPKTLNPQTSVSYKSDVVSLGEEVQEVVIKNAEAYKDSSFTNAAFAEPCDIHSGVTLTNKGGNSGKGNETKSVGIATGMKIVISRDNDDEDATCEIRNDSPIRKSAQTYSEIDLGRESGMDSPRLGRISKANTPDESVKKGKFKMKFRNTKK